MATFIVLALSALVVIVVRNLDVLIERFRR
jgi:hypothetical protein